MIKKFEEFNESKKEKKEEDLPYLKIKDGKYKYNYSKMVKKDFKDRYDFHRKSWEDSGEDRTNGSIGKHHLTMMRTMDTKRLFAKK